MRNATPVLPFKMRRPTRRHYFLRVNFRPFSFFTCTTHAKINPGNDEWAAYNQLNALRYIHQTVNHKSTICGSGHWRSYKQHGSIIFYISCCLLSIFVVRLLLVASFRCLFVHLFFVKFCVQNCTLKQQMMFMSQTE